jgi:membrane-associated protease RseP (regulator of RpoE activity)
MLPEPALTPDSRPHVRTPALVAAEPPGGRDDGLRAWVGEVLAIERERYTPGEGEDGLALPLIGPETHLAATFEGRLLLDSEAAYARLDAHLNTRDLLALFRPAPPSPTAALADGATEAGAPGTRVHVHIVRGRPRPKPRSPWLNAVLLVATLFSVLIVGTSIAIGEIGMSSPAAARAIGDDLFANLWRGLPYALSILAILGAHELGHYFAGRYHRLAVTLPYFIPAPFISPLGTFGAFIQLREPSRNRKMLIDIGAAGPMCGMVVALPILAIGLATSIVAPITPGGTVEGNSLVYALLKTLIFGRFLPDGTVDVLVNQLAWAGWTGLLVTSLNLIPVGQLDGGHIAYALFGEYARRLYVPALVALGVMAFVVSDVWLFWLLLLFLFGSTYAVPLDTVTPLDRRRRIVGLIALAVFVVTFTPVPFSQTDVLLEGAAERQGLFSIPTAAAVLGVWLAASLRRR